MKLEGQCWVVNFTDRVYLSVYINISLSTFCVIFLDSEPNEVMIV